jgi:arylsulfatase A-like enzyme
MKIFKLLMIFLIASNVSVLASPDKVKPYNMIFILLDDLRFDGVGFLTPEVQTPNIDALAAGGTYFPNALVTSSLCSPSRATILTGMTARNHGIVDNNNSSEQNLTFFPKYLQDAGYRTGFFGKWHMGDQHDGPREGFDKWVSFSGQGAYYPTDGIPKPLLDKGRVNELNVDGTHVPQKGYITDELTDYAMDWLEEGRDESKPFFLYLSHKAVHSDAKPAARHLGQYDNTNFHLPDTSLPSEETQKNKPMWVQNQRNSWHGIDFFYASDRKMTDYLKDYFGALSAVDDSVGRILHWLKDSGELENTVVVFYSDNGFLIGDHGLIDKRNAYEGSVRVPLVVYSPGLIPEGDVNPAVVRNLDLAPTFLDIAGIESPSQFEGVSVLKVATHEVDPSTWQAPDFVYEYFWEYNFGMTPTTFAIRRGNFKYIQYHGVWDIEELYDLKNDPQEKQNLFFKREYRPMVQDLREGLAEKLLNKNGERVVPYTPRLSDGVNLRDENGPKAASFPKEWQTYPNREDMYMGLFPDTPLKLEKQDNGEAYFPYMEGLEE